LGRNKIVALGEKGNTVEVVLHRTLDKAEHIDKMIVLYRWKNSGGWTSDWSTVSISDMEFATTMLHLKASENMKAAWVEDGDAHLDNIAGDEDAD
jgi:hypothetical protein